MFLKNLIKKSQQLLLSKQIRKMSNCENFIENGKKILGAAVNYMDVVKAKCIPVPEEPLLFFKPTSSYIKEGHDIIIPNVFSRVAYEVELGVIIGKKCKNVTKKEAMNYVAGYCLALDLTAQCHLEKARGRGQPWSLAKGFDTSTPVSRFITTKEIEDPHNLEIWLTINCGMKQKGYTKDLIFNIPELIEYASKHMVLEPNDLILTGTPDGSAPMKPLDRLSCGISDVISMNFNVVEEEEIKKFY